MGGSSSSSPAFHYIQKPNSGEARVLLLEDFSRYLTHVRSVLLAFITFLTVGPDFPSLCRSPVLSGNVHVSLESITSDQSLHTQASDALPLIINVSYYIRKMSSFSPKHLFCIWSRPAFSPSPRLSKWMKCSNKSQRMRIHCLGVKTALKISINHFHSPKCILKICNSYPAAAPSPECFPGTAWPWVGCQGLPLFVCLGCWCPLLFWATVWHVRFHRKLRMENIRLCPL
jgi:hypothetical protein